MAECQMLFPAPYPIPPLKNAVGRPVAGRPQPPKVRPKRFLP